MTTPVVSTASVQRRTMRTLVVGQVLGSVGVTSGTVVATIAAASLAPSVVLAGFSQTASTLGSAVAAAVLAAVANAHGRRRGLLVGYLTGAAGAALCILAAVVGMFWLFLLGMVLYGSATAANLQSRYAATDLAPSGAKGRYLSVIVAMTTVGGLVGPNTSGAATGFGLPHYAGSFVLALSGFVLAAGVAWLFLRPDPLQLARSAATGVNAAPRRPGLRAGIAGLTDLRARAALTCVASSHAVMTAMMSMTSLHMRQGGAPLAAVGIVYSAHFVGMYAFSPLFGWLSDRLGRPRLVLCGLGLLLASCALAVSADFVLLTVSLLGVGLGWSCVLVTASAMVSDSVELDRRPAVQGLSDVLMGVSAAVAGAVGGAIVAYLGFPTLAVLCGALLVPAAVFVWRQR
ncbi:MFS transporter [Kutzneria sp. CA-103260]|uniref:MFS transporter n=1 Tax=Kutzneria sp. CA-103260 TaxID=2802641 RepID=UPI001BA66B8A|nr:MFS transporter [Kutzneria sp. CA-103260]